ncbi:hypothetical protein ACQP25_44500 (plasmid) [Microtetraspora malaysiensis]|uniref:hypothetical protein n=1 Tax=Microtetraspora malaysiensis TaxID=161358 RepID=UPI003D8C785C
MLNLDAAKAARTAKKGGGLIPIVFGGEEICQVATELPMDALSPLLDLTELDLPMLLRTGMDGLGKDNDFSQALTDMADMAINLLFSNRDLPKAIVEAVKEIGRRVLTPEGFDRFFAKKPSVNDVIELVRGLSKVYGVGLGESGASSSGSPAGTTSTPTSDTTSTDSTLPESGQSQESPASSEFAGSSATANDSHPML